MNSKAISESVYKLGRILIDVAEVIVIIFIGLLIILTVYITFKDILMELHGMTAATIQILVNDILMIIIYAEILRSILIIWEMRGEGFLSQLSDVAFIVAVREILVYAITGKSMDILLAVFSLLIVTLAIYLIKTRIEKTGGP
ncbi:phosphate-starvation-inducible PsiE family protein [Desulfurococcus amylolyticus]|mgnify:CR=1 FL=1|uniref:phosphate-starvation-inducible PsiE family protein n=1 Tax=Desulfurococcus amylolyticus TaxID=94694 RepID=UPI0023F4187F|nr:phosphate-starvation-inducible PsiE family protein [Desulfurococcus amylolyticus]